MGPEIATILGIAYVLLLLGGMIFFVKRQEKKDNAVIRDHIDKMKENHEN